MIKQSLIALSFLGTALAHAQKSGEIVNTTYTTTFSHYGNLNNVLSCQPGIKGGYALTDDLSLRSHAVEIDFDFSNDGDLVHRSGEAIARERQNSGGRGPPSERPYAEGCKPLMDRILAEIEGKELVEVTVNRRVLRYLGDVTLVRRDLSGKVIRSVSRNKVQRLLEIVTVDFAGLEFTKVQSINLESSPH